MKSELPFTVKRSIELLGLVLVGFVIYQLQGIIMPMLMALVAAIALSPLYRFLVSKKIPRSLSIVLSIILMLITIALIIFFIGLQLKPVITEYGTIKENISNHIRVVSDWFSIKTGISTAEQSSMIQKQATSILDSAGVYFTTALGSVGGFFIFFILFPIYTFLILFYRDILKQFLLMWFERGENKNVLDVLKSIETVIHSYLGGLLIQVSYMTILLGLALILFGIDYALLIAIIFAVLNLIPYVGAFIGNFIGVLLTISSSPSLTPVITVLIIITIVQFLDNNILMPAIVGSKVRINALATLFGVILFGAIAGISGMFLSLPLIASFKIIFDHTDDFKKWGVLLGDTRPTSNMLTKFKKKVKKE